MVADIDLVLAAVDGSEQSVDAAEYGAAVADQYGANLHVLHILDQPRKRGVEDGDLSTEQIATDQQELTDRLRSESPDSVRVEHSGAVGFSENRLGQTPGSAILDAGAELDADFLVVPRVSANAGTDGVLGKAALHVLEYASQPVLSV